MELIKKIVTCVTHNLIKLTNTSNTQSSLFPEFRLSFKMSVFSICMNSAYRNHFPKHDNTDLEGTREEGRSKLTSESENPLVSAVLGLTFVGRLYEWGLYLGESTKQNGFGF